MTSQQKPSFDYEAFNTDLLYLSDEDEETSVADPDALEDYRETRSLKNISREYVATIDYDHLYDDMIFPS